MQGVSPPLKIASPSPRDVDFSGSRKRCKEGEKMCLKCWEIAF